MLGDRTAAEDIAAEALARAYAHWSRVATLDWREAWVLRVTGNLALDQLRRRRPALGPPLAHDFEDSAALRMALSDAVGRLPRRQQEAVVLYYLAGYSEADVARTLGISPNSVKTHLRRAREVLRSGLEFDEGTHFAPA